MSTRLGLDGKIVLLTGGAGIYGRGLSYDLLAAGVLASGFGPRLVRGWLRCSSCPGPGLARGRRL
jgi:hypothetical protein